MRGLVVVLAAVVLGGCTSTGPHPGADGAGDSYYPQDGNGGYDAAAYRLSIDYDPPTRRLDGNQLITARVTENLSSFNLDLSGLTVDSVVVDGSPAHFRRTGEHELVVTPKRSLARGAQFATEIRYHGTPQAVDGNGWQYTADGGAFVLGEPDSAATWYPVNDTPRDKATFELTVHVPDGWSAVSTGRDVGGNTWTSSTPTAPYLTTVAIDRWDIQRGKLADGTPLINAYAPGVPSSTKDAEARLPEVLDFLASKFGPYPVDAAGGIFLTEPIGASLETLGRPIYSGRAGDLETIVHENAHQWYGNSVSVRDWKDICLNECFASYAPWLWSEAKDGQNLDDRFRQEVASAPDSLWAARLYDMGAGREFTAVYRKGPLALHALRRHIGDPAFDQVLRTWPAAHRDGNASLPEFQHYVENVTHHDLSGFFQAWFYGTGKPAAQYLG
ncbi:MAG TPA: M1 family metallopeptidase [Amycolatopsis sp.]|nr:M1 family metallopeptidase [Amycolatopsis sp.]